MACGQLRETSTTPGLMMELRRGKAEFGGGDAKNLNFFNMQATAGRGDPVGIYRGRCAQMMMMDRHSGTDAPCVSRAETRLVRHEPERELRPTDSQQGSDTLGL